MIDLRYGDCLELMKDIPDKSIDLIVTDPPYKVTSRGGSGTMGVIGKKKEQSKESFLILIVHLAKNICLSFIES